MNKEHWTKLKQSVDIPPPRDDHAMGRVDNEEEPCFFIFGGFVNGSRVNDVYCGGFFGGDTVNWKKY